MVLGGFDLGAGSGLDSSASAGTTGWTSGLKKSGHSMWICPLVVGCSVDHKPLPLHISR